MNEYRESLKYIPSDDRVKISGRRSVRKSKAYRARQAMKQRIAALALAGGIAVGAIGVGTAVKNYSQAQEEKYISNFEEIEAYNITSQDLQMSPEMYEEILSLNQELGNAEQRGFEGITNLELASYYSKMAEVYLNTLKEKVSTVTGLRTSEFTLVAPSASGGEAIGTQVKDRDMLKGVANLDSKEVDDYMRDIIELRNYHSQIITGDINREQLEKLIIEYKDKLGEVATINFLKELSSRDGNMPSLTTYRIETRGLQQNSDSKETQEMELE